MVGAFLALILLTSVGIILKLTLRVVCSSYFQGLSASDSLYAVFWGVRFDLAISVLFLAPSVLMIYFLARFFKMTSFRLWWFTIPFSFFIFIQGGDGIYFENTGKHVGYEIRQTIADFHELLATAISGYTLLVLCSVIAAIIFFLLGKKRITINYNSWAHLDLPVLLWLILGFLLVRGSFSDTPMTPNMAYRIGSTEQSKLALNGAYSALYGAINGQQKKSLIEGNNWLKEEQNIKSLTDILNVHQGRYIPPVKKMNIVIVLLESWSGQFVHSVNPESENITPKFDKLNQDGISVDGMLAGGVRTHEGMFSILCSYQNPLGGGVPETSLQQYSYNCLPSLLREAGWKTSIFQGSHTKMVGDFALQLGAEKSYGKLDITEHNLPPNYWGYQDPDLYDFVIKHAETQKFPFLYIINTTTTHDLVLPPNEKWVFGNGSLLQKRKSVLNYADKALGDFVNKWKENISKPTLFVLVADHTAGGSDPINQFTIPFLMFASDGSVRKQHVSGIVSQRDIAPTVIQHLGGFVPWFSGNALQTTKHTEADFFTGGIMGWVYDNHLIKLNLITPNKLECQYWEKSLMFSRNVDCTKLDEKIKSRLLAFTSYSQKLLFSGKTRNFGDMSFRDGSK